MRTILSIALATAAALQLVACDRVPTEPANLGPNKYLTIGPGNPLPHPTTPPIDAVIGITAGYAHTCVSKWSGMVACWGWNQSGQVGAPTTAQCASGPCAPQPVTVTGSAGAPSFTSGKLVTAGDSHTCALDPAGAAWCWGDGTFGALGSGPSGYRFSPVPVAGGIAYQTLAAGNAATCGSSTGGSLFCWGSYPMVTQPAYTPTLVVNYGFPALAVARDHLCGDIAPAFWACYGLNRYGQLGVDTARTPSAPPNSWTVINGATHVAMTYARTCVDQATGAVQCFGDNASQSNNGSAIYLLGNPSFTGGWTFQPQTVGTLHGVVVSDSHACALDGSGNAWCWGLGDAGQLGVGTFTGSSSPEMVSGVHTFSALAVGHFHSCGIGTDGHVYCWGDNSYGQLGQPAAGYSATSPVQVAQL